MGSKTTPKQRSDKLSEAEQEHALEDLDEAIRTSAASASSRPKPAGKEEVVIEDDTEVPVKQRNPRLRQTCQVHLREPMKN